MSNHVHLIVVPQTACDLRPIGEAHRRYARYLNGKMRWTGYLWQGRFASYPMDERYAYEAVRYVELNPVRAAICTHPAQYRWSSARQRIGKFSEHDMKVKPAAFLSVDNWEAYWQESLRASRTGITEQLIANEQQQKTMGLLQ